MKHDHDISALLLDLKKLAPAGYALAFHIRFTTPTFLFQTYPKAWSDYYSQNGLVMSDPTVAWGFENVGTRRWSDLARDDAAGVMQKASEHGLAFGATVAIDIEDSRSLSSFARNDREFSDAEIADLKQRVEELHQLTAQISALSPETAKNLRSMSVNIGPDAV